MKIIAGERKGFILATPKGVDTRPTLSRVRESLFSIIAGDIPGSVFLDLYAGAGSIGFEALSRGAEKAIFVEIAREPWTCLRQNAEKLGYQKQSNIVHSDALRWEIPTGEAGPDIIFADPPYDPVTIGKLIHKLEVSPLNPDTLIILQTPAKYQIETRLTKLRDVKYGTTAVHFLLSASQLPTSEATVQPATDSR